MKSELSGVVHHGGGLLKTWKKKNEYDMLQRRKVLSGYPKTFKFQNESDVFNYLNNEKIVCLLCGKLYKFLGLHIKIHGENVESYKEKYNIKAKQGLIGTKLKHNMIAITKERNQTDLKEKLNEFYENRILATHCSCGQKLNKHRRCTPCSTEYKRKLKGYLPRHVAQKTLVTKNCYVCNVEIIRCRLGNRKKNYCSPCKNKKYYESQKKYADANQEKRKEMAKIAYEKRKLKLKTS